MALEIGKIRSQAAHEAMHPAFAVPNGDDLRATWSFRHATNATVLTRIESCAGKQATNRLSYAPQTNYWRPRMKATQNDSIIAEVHRVRDANAARFNYDVAKIFRNTRARQEKSDRKFVRYPPRPMVSGAKAASGQARSS